MAIALLKVLNSMQTNQGAGEREADLCSPRAGISWCAAGMAIDAALHSPAVAAVVLASLQHTQRVQVPGALEALQQQPPAQRSAPQSKFEAQGSPGMARMHAPECSAHCEQPARAAEARQQCPPRHALAAPHAESEEHGAPALADGAPALATAPAKAAKI